MIDFLTSKKFKIFLVWLIFLFLVFSSLSSTLAIVGETPGEPPSQPPPGRGALNILENVKAEAGGEIPYWSDPIMTIVKIINYLLTFIGVIFILIIIYGGFLWMTGFEPHEFTFGHEEQVKKAKKLIKQAVLGLIIVILAKVLYYFIWERLKPPTLPGGTK